MQNVTCRRCKSIISLAEATCSCANGVPDLRRITGVSSQYADLYDEIASDDLDESMQPHEMKRQRAKKDIQNLRSVLRHRQNLNILEIGPGSGYLAKELTCYGSVFVLDITPRYIEKLDFVSGRFIGDVELLPFENQFDLIVMCDVLEHVLNEGDSLLSIHRALRTGGAIYIRCPSNEPLVSYAQKLGSKFPYVHLRSYTRKSLRRALEHSGHQNVKTQYSSATALGFARRDFRFPNLRIARSRRFIAEIQYSLTNQGSVQKPKGLDLFLTYVEAATWRIAKVLRLPIFVRVTGSLWYRPSEVWAIGTKRIDLPITLLEHSK